MDKIIILVFVSNGGVRDEHQLTLQYTGDQAAWGIGSTASCQGCGGCFTMRVDKLAFPEGVAKVKDLQLISDAGRLKNDRVITTRHLTLFGWWRILGLFDCRAIFMVMFLLSVAGCGISIRAANRFLVMGRWMSLRDCPFVFKCFNKI